LWDRRQFARAGAACSFVSMALFAGCGASKSSNGLADGSGGSSATGTGGASTGGTGGAGSSHGGAAGRGGSGGDLIVEQAGAGGACEREVTLQAVVLGEPAPFDLVIVADHSDSLAWSRDELSAGLRDLLTNVKGRAVRVFLLTPTQYGASSAAARIPLSGDAVVAWQDPETGMAFEGAMTEFVQTCTDPSGASIDCPDPRGSVPYKAHGEWQFAMPEPIATLEPDMTDAAFAAESQAVSDAILALGGTGSPSERPLCTLARYVSQPKSDLPENAVFVVISDEDDVGVPEDCILSFDSELEERQRVLSETPCGSDCDVYRYQMTRPSYWIRHPYTCAAFTDMGDLIPGSEMMSWYNITGQTSCDNVVEGPCTPEDEAKVQTVCDSGLTLTSCETTCTEEETSCTVDLTDPSIDACNETFTHDGITKANLTEWCNQFATGWSNCTGGGLNIEYETDLIGGYTHKNLMAGTTVDAVIQHVTSGLVAAFGADKVLFEGIVFDPRFDCALGSGQSYAENIIRAIDDPSHVFSLCDSYAPALAGVLDFAQALIQTEFTLKLADDEHVTAIVVIDENGTERVLPKSDYTFDETTGRLSVSKAAIRGSDANLRVEVTSDCRPIVK
jgi:hypothetical protein